MAIWTFTFRLRSCGLPLRITFLKHDQCWKVSKYRTINSSSLGQFKVLSPLVRVALMAYPGVSLRFRQQSSSIFWSTFGGRFRRASNQVICISWDRRSESRRPSTLCGSQATSNRPTDLSDRLWKKPSNRSTPRVSPCSRRAKTVQDVLVVGRVFSTTFLHLPVTAEADCGGKCHRLRHRGQASRQVCRFASVATSTSMPPCVRARPREF